MGKMKEKLIEDMIMHPDIYIEREDYEFWIQCRKEELLEREGKPTIKLIRKGKHVRRRNKEKSSKI
mgnify:CR=1 FL=1|jgi:hypothetical protein